MKIQKHPVKKPMVRTRRLFLEQLEDRRVLSTFGVNTFADTVDVSPGDGVAEDADGNTSLRAAIMEANALAGADQINLVAGVYEISIGRDDNNDEPTGDLDISSEITIVGAGADVTTIDAKAIDRVFEIKGNASISGVKITGGDRSGAYGGGVLIGDDVVVSMDSVVVTDNFGRFGTGGISNQGDLTITNSELSENRTNFEAGALWVWGDSGKAVVKNTTISGNTADNAGGIAVWKEANSLTLENVTIVNNSAVFGGGGLKFEEGTVTLQNTIVAGNTAADGNDIRGTIVSLGNNIIGDQEKGAGFVASDLLDTDPKLGDLEDVGATTRVHVPQSDSPAIDGGAETSTTTDQVGNTRGGDGNSDGDAGFDIGAYEIVLGSISGTVFQDVNGDGLKQTTEAKLGNVGVYLDSNNNGQLDEGEHVSISSEDDISTETIDEAGQYHFAHLEPGQYDVRLLVGNGVSHSSIAVSEKTTYQMGPSPHEIIAVDVDGDGDNDLISANFSDNAPDFSIRRNDGNGNFSELENGPNLYRAIGVSAADLDNDGDIDLVTSKRGNGVVIWKNDGTGAFTFAQDIIAGNYTTRPYINDFNGDGYQDVAFMDSHDSTNQSNSLYVAMNDGTGTLNSDTSYVIANGTQGDVSGGDLDNDGDIDLVIPNRISNEVTIMLNNGSGGFSRDNTRAIALDKSLRQPLIRDFNNDGNLDIAGVSQGTKKFHLFSNDGTANFTESFTFDNEEYPRSLIDAADLDADGDLDITFARGYSSLIVLKNNGNAEFEFASKYTGGDFLIGPRLADLNGDGFMDIIGTNRDSVDASIYINQTGLRQTEVSIGSQVIVNPLGAIAPVNDFGDAPIPYPVLDAAGGAQHVAIGPRLGDHRDSEFDGTHSVLANTDDGDDGVIFGTVQVGQLDATATVNVQNAPDGAKLDAWIDFNGDGSWGGAWEHIAAGVHVADGNNTIEFDVPANAVAGNTYARFRLSTTGNLGIGGATDDGEVEDYQVEVIPPARASKLFGNLTQITALADEAWSVVSGDFNGDGDLDLASASRLDNKIAWYENDGSESFTTHVITTDQGEAETVFASDIDSDGDLDLLSASQGGDKVEWHENDGSGSFQTHVISNSMDGALDVHAADIDNDGDTDVFATSWRDDKLIWFENDGTQNFTAHVLGPRTRRILVTDMDGDGDSDILVGGKVSPHIEWYENDGAQSFTRHIISNESGFTHGISAGDIDQDGDMDVVSASTADNEIAWHRNNGESGFEAISISIGGEPTSAYLSDLDGDGDLDIVATIGGLDQVVAYWNDGSSNPEFDSQVISSEIFSGRVAITADIDQDGDLDIATASAHQDEIAWFAQNASPSMESVDNLTIPEDAPEQTVDLTGISAGGGETQPLRVTAISSNTDLIADPTVSYTSAESTGSLKFTPVADQHGTSIITVTVEDGGLDGDLDTSGDNATSSRTFDVTVSAVNDDPTLDPVLENQPVNSWNQLGIDIDGEAAGDQSASVSLSADGSTVAIGAHHNDGNGTGSGHVRIYRWADGSWNQLGTDIDGEAAVDGSGFSVSLSADGSTVAIAAPYNDGNGTDSGHVRIYRFADGSWSQLGSDIAGKAAGDQSGYSVSLSDDGSTVAIGARNNDGNGAESGHVRIYRWADDSWNQLGTDIDGESAGDRSGYSVTLSTDGSTVAIGAPYNDGNETESGHVRIYRWAEGSWNQLGSDIDGEAAGDRSAYSVSLSADGSIVAIGAHRNDGNGTDSGHVRIYRWAEDSWNLLGSDIDGEAAGDHSGYSVSLSADGSTVAIGAYGNNGNGTDSGHVRIYHWADGNWNQLGTDIDGEAAGDASGESVSLSADGSTVAIGARLNDGNGTDSGHVRIYRWADITLAEDAPEQTVDLTGISAGGGETQPLRVTATSSNTDLFADPTVSYTSAESTGSLKFTPEPDQHGTSTITVTVEDGGLDGDLETAGDNATFSRTFDVTVSAVNDDPTLDAIDDLAIAEDAPEQTVDLTGITAGGGETQPLRVTATSSNTDLIADPTVSYTSAESAGSLKFTPVADQHGTSIITVTVEDSGLDGDLDTAGDNATFSRTFDVTVNPVNDAPILDADASPELDPSPEDALPPVGAVGTVVSALIDANGTHDNFSDVDGDQPGLAIVNIAPQGGSVWISRDNGHTWNILDEASEEQPVLLLADMVSRVYFQPAKDFHGEIQDVLTIRAWDRNSIRLIEGFGNAIEGSTLGDHSGIGLALSSDGSTIAIGAHRHDNEQDNVGQVRVFQWSGSEWAQLGSDIYGEGTNDELGYALSLSADGTVLAVGAHLNDGTAADAGHARVYSWNGESWIQLGSDLDGYATNDWYGVDVDLSNDGTILAVGARNGGANDGGYTDVFRWNGVDWEEIGQRLMGQRGGGRFGESISLSANGAVIAIGAEFSSAMTGEAVVYAWDGQQWQQMGSTFTAESSADRFGHSVSISASGEVVAISAHYDDENGTDSGHTRIFQWNGADWEQKGQDIDGEDAGDKSGYDISLSDDGNRIAISARFNDGGGNNSGHARIYQWNGSRWLQFGDDIDGASNDELWRLTLSGDGTKVATGNFKKGGSNSAGLTTVYRLEQIPLESSISTETDFVSMTVEPVNDDPTLNAIDDLSVAEDAPEQTVYLTGISAGGGETQPLRVTATSSNTDLIADPAVNPGESWQSDNLIAHYPFNGNASDKSGNGHDGDIHGPTLVQDRFGNLNSAYSFDGTDDYIRYQGELLTEKPFTWSIWFNLADTPTEQQMLIAQADAPGEHRISPHLSILDGKLEFGSYDIDTGGNNVIDNQTETLNSGQWYHAVVTSDIEGNRRLYLDGELVGSAVWDNFGQVLGNTYIGTRAGTMSQNVFNGYIDDVRVIKSALSAEDVLELHQFESGHAQLTFTPVADQHGTSTITVTVEENEGDQLYWVNNSPDRSVYRANADGTSTEAILASSSIGHSTYIDIHEATQQLYVYGYENHVNTGPGFVKRSELDGSNVTTVIDTGLTTLHYGFDIDQTNNRLYMGSTYPWRQSHLDGSNMIQMDGPKGYTHDIEVDEVNSKVYYTKDLSGIYRMNLDGSNIEELLDIPHAFGIALDLSNNRFYYSSLTQGSSTGSNGQIYSYNLSNGNNTLITGGVGALDIELNQSTQTIYAITDTKIQAIDLVTSSVSDVLTLPNASATNASLELYHPQNLQTSHSFDVVVTPANDTPTLDPITNVTIDDDAREQTVDLTGISAGGGESQPLRISATSSDVDIVTSPIVDYSSDDATGSLSFSPVEGVDGTATITVTVEDGGLDGDLSTVGDNAAFSQTFEVDVYNDDVQIRLEAVDAAGNVVDRIREDRDFAIRMYTQDLRENGRGVFAAYADIGFDESIANATATPTYADPYVNAKRANLDSADGVTELGAIADVDELGTDEYLVATLPMYSKEPGSFAVSASYGTNSPHTDILVYGNNDELLAEQVRFIGENLTVYDAGTLPYYETFDDGQADDLIELTSSDWNVLDKAYVASTAHGVRSFALADLTVDLPGSYTLSADAMVTAGGGGRYSNAFLAYDYQNSSNFKFAGVLAGSGDWTLGEMKNGQISFGEKIRLGAEQGTWLNMSLVVEDKTASFYSGDELVSSHTYSDMLNDGDAGLYVFNATTTFDNLSITVPSPEPDAVDDTSQTTSGQSIVIDVLANDVPVEGTTISIKSVETGEGDVAIEDGKLTYTPSAGFRGIDTFNYTIQDSDGLTDSAQVSVTVAAGLPIEEDFSDSLAQDFTAVMGDWEIEAERWHVASEKGKFGLAVANIGEALPDEFSVEAVFNGQGGGGGFWSNAFVIADYQDNENFKFAGSFIGGNTWTIGEVIGGTIHRRAEHLETVNTGTDYHVKADVQGRTLTLVVDGTAKKSYTFSDDLNDGQAGIGTINARASFDDIVIKAAIPMPEAKNDHAQTTSGQSILIDVLANDVPVEGTTISIISASGAEGDVAIEDGKIRYAPSADYRGSDQFSYTIEDSDGLTDSAKVYITVAAGLPIEEDFSDSLAQDFTPHLGTWTVSEERYHVTPEKGKFGVALANIGEALPDEFSTEAVFNGQGGGGGYWSNAFVIVDFQDNENFKFAGSFIGGNSWTIGEVIGGTVHRRNVATETINTNTDYHIKADVQGQTLTLIANDQAKLSYTFGDGLSDGRTGVGTINARASFDDIVIKAATPMPEAKNDIASTLRGQSVVIDVLANDIPVDGTTITLDSAEGGDGNVAIADGKVTYVPSAGFSGQDTFNYTIKDSDGLTDTGKVTVIVAAALPVEEDFDDGIAQDFVAESGDWTLTSGRYKTEPEKTTNGISLVSIGEPLPDQFTFDATIIGRSSAGHWKNAFTIFDYEDAENFKFAGSFIGANQWSIGEIDNGTLHHLSDLKQPIDLETSYQISVEFSNNTVTLLHEGEVKVRHEFEEDIRNGQLGLGTINAVAEFDDISIVSAAPMPKAADDQAQTLTNTSVVIDVLANDVPVEGTTIALKSVSGGQGTATIENGKVSYAPETDFIGEDTFTYIMEDSDGLTDTGKVSVTVAPGLPYSEDFNDHVADGFKEYSDSWHISEQQYLTASAKGATNLATVQLGEPLPDEFEMGATLAMLTENGYWTNAWVAFDVESEEDFKYAGVYKGLGVWAVGHYHNGKDHRLATVQAESNANTDYAVKLLFDGEQVTLNVDGSDLLDYTFSDTLNDGDLGLATRNAHARYDDVYIKSVDDVLGEWE